MTEETLNTYIESRLVELDHKIKIRQSDKSRLALLARAAELDRLRRKMGVRSSIERARRAQQRHQQKHDVQLEVPSPDDP